MSLTLESAMELTHERDSWIYHVEELSMYGHGIDQIGIIVGATPAAVRYLLNYWEAKRAALSIEQKNTNRTKRELAAGIRTIDTTTFGTLMGTVRHIFPEGQAGEDEDGQIIIHTGLFCTGNTDEPLTNKPQECTCGCNGDEDCHCFDPDGV